MECYQSGGQWIDEYTTVRLVTWLVKNQLTVLFEYVSITVPVGSYPVRVEPVVTVTGYTVAALIM